MSRTRRNHPNGSNPTDDCWLKRDYYINNDIGEFQLRYYNQSKFGSPEAKVNTPDNICSCTCTMYNVHTPDCILIYIQHSNWIGLPQFFLRPNWSIKMMISICGIYLHSMLWLVVFIYLRIGNFYCLRDWKSRWIVITLWIC